MNMKNQEQEKSFEDLEFSESELKSMEYDTLGRHELIEDGEFDILEDDYDPLDELDAE